MATLQELARQLSGMTSGMTAANTNPFSSMQALPQMPAASQTQAGLNRLLTQQMTGAGVQRPGAVPGKAPVPVPQVTGVSGPVQSYLGNGVQDLLAVAGRNGLSMPTMMSPAEEALYLNPRVNTLQPISSAPLQQAPAQGSGGITGGLSGLVSGAPSQFRQFQGMPATGNYMPFQAVPFTQTRTQQAQPRTATVSQGQLQNPFQMFQQRGLSDILRNWQNRLGYGRNRSWM